MLRCSSLEGIVDSSSSKTIVLRDQTAYFYHTLLCYIEIKVIFFIQYT